MAESETRPILAVLEAAISAGLWALFGFGMSWLPGLRKALASRLKPAALVVSSARVLAAVNRHCAFSAGLRPGRAGRVPLRSGQMA